MAPKKAKKAKPPELTGGAAIAVELIKVLAKAIDSLGIPIVMFVLILGSIAVMGDARTKNDFIREVLFGEVTKSRTLSAFFLSLIGTIVLSGTRLGWLWKKEDRLEMRRLGAQKSELQEKLIGRRLHHTRDMRRLESGEELEGVPAPRGGSTDDRGNK